MIENFYARHIKDTLDASAINVQGRRRRPRSKGEPIPAAELAEEPTLA
jgi:hypothetical protein